MIISKVILSILAFYLLIFCNYTKELIGCKLNYILNTNIYAKHIIAFLLLYFLIIIVDSDNIENSYFYNFGITFFIYIIFIITTRIPYYLIIIILILLIILYIINKYKKKEEAKQENKNENEINKYFYMELSLIITIFIFMSIGFVYYGFEKYCEYKKSFSLLKFIIGDIKCKVSSS